MISVIVPVYNVEKFLPKCIESIVNQSFRDIEIILVDDGSTDASGEICDLWAKCDERIKVIHKDNGGLSDARNKGIEMSSGEYLSFIDSDDYILPDYLLILYQILTSEGADMSVCQCFFVDEQDRNLTELNDTDKITLIKGNFICMREFLTNTDIDTVAWRKLYKSSLFVPEIRYPVGKYHEDVWTTYKYIAKCNSIVVSYKKLYAYRQRKGSIVNSQFNTKHLDGVTGSIKRFEFISSRYPDLKSQSAANIIYCANQCMLRLGKSLESDSTYLEFLKTIYKKYLKYYLYGRSSIKGKIFAVFARYFPRILLNIISLS